MAGLWDGPKTISYEFFLSEPTKAIYAPSWDKSLPLKSMAMVKGLLSTCL
jgi:hypothetical protein